MTATPTPPSIPVHEPDYHELLPLRISRGLSDEPSAYSVVFNGVELARHLASDGVRFEFVDAGMGVAQPQITLKFSPDAVALDLDALLVTFLRQKAALDSRAPSCPECVQGKHTNCTGETLHVESDQMVWCGCGCEK